MKINDILKLELSRRDMLRRTAFGLTGALMAGLSLPVLLARPARAAQAVGGKILTVVYSRTGNTRLMAGYIHELVGGDLVELETVNPYPEAYRATTKQAKEELESGFKPPLKTKIENLGAYDVVCVGSPCWWGTVATPVITFLSENDFAGKTLVPFMTHEGSGLGRTESHIRSLCPASTVLEGLAIRGGRVGSARDDVSTWLREIGMGS